MANLNVQQNDRANSYMDEKKDNSYYQPAPSPQPPPAYGAPPPQANWPPLAQATALYAYNSTDAGDLALQPNDHITVTEYMNAEWWKGKSSRTGQEGIFPRSYVKVIDDKASTSNNYGNAPLEVSGMGNGQGKVPSKVQEGTHFPYGRNSIPYLLTLDRRQKVWQEAWKRRHFRCRSYHGCGSCQQHLLSALKWYGHLFCFRVGVGCIALEIPLGRNTVCIIPRFICSLIRVARVRKASLRVKR